MDRTFNVLMAAGQAGPFTSKPFDLGRADSDRDLEVEISAMGTACIAFKGQLTATDIQGIIGVTQNNVGEVIAVCDPGGRVTARIDEDVRAITLYLLANAPANPAGVTVRVKT